MPCDKHQFTYANAGIHPRVGDRARFIDRPNELLVVDAVIDSSEKQEMWGWEGDEYGIVLKGDPYGRVATERVSTEVEFVSRDEESKP
jgi:hypothetical protein